MPTSRLASQANPFEKGGCSLNEIEDSPGEIPDPSAPDLLSPEKLRMQLRQLYRIILKLVKIREANCI